MITNVDYINRHLHPTHWDGKFDLLIDEILAQIPPPVSGGDSFRWYDGGKGFRVLADFNPFTASYVENSIGNYEFTAPNGQMIKEIQGGLFNSGANENMNGSGIIIIVNTPTGNATNQDQTIPTVTLKEASGTLRPLGVDASGGVTSSGGVATITLNNLNSYVLGGFKITGFIQNPS